eukprot:1817717-Rhodomonas_salina.2
MAGLRRGEGGYGKVTEIALSFKFKLVNFIVQMVPLVPVGKVPVPGTSSTTAQYRLRSEGSLVHWAVRNARVKGRAPGVYALTNRVERSAVLTSTVISLGCKPSAFRHSVAFPPPLQRSLTEGLQLNRPATKFADQQYFEDKVCKDGKTSARAVYSRQISSLGQGKADRVGPSSSTPKKLAPVSLQASKTFVTPQTSFGTGPNFQFLNKT